MSAAAGRAAGEGSEAVAEPRRVQERGLHLAERREVRGVVEDLDAARAEQALLALVVHGLDGDGVDAVRVARRVDVQDEARDDRLRVVGIVRGDVGAVDARHGLPLEEAVHEDVHVVDLAVVERPARHLENAVRAHAAVGQREVQAAERRLVVRVVDLDRPAASGSTSSRSRP